MLSPILEQISEENDSVTILKVNVDKEQALSAQFGIRSIPTVLFFRGGQEVDKFLGAQPKSKVLELIEKNSGATAEVESDESED
jgi:thioredoxin 1